MAPFGSELGTELTVEAAPPLPPPRCGIIDTAGLGARDDPAVVLLLIGRTLSMPLPGGHLRDGRAEPGRGMELVGFVALGWCVASDADLFGVMSACCAAAAAA